LIEAVLDASVVLKWFAAEERGTIEARKFRDAYASGRLVVVVPALLCIEILNVAGRRWKWNADDLLELAQALSNLMFEVVEPQLQTVAPWVGRGLSAYEATYVALAEERGLVLVTDDETIIKLAPDMTHPLIRTSPPTT
jgi:predicted nucleic acid-binding protein